MKMITNECFGSCSPRTPRWRPRVRRTSPIPPQPPPPNRRIETARTHRERALKAHGAKRLPTRPTTPSSSSCRAAATVIQRRVAGWYGGAPRVRGQRVGVDVRRGGGWRRLVRATAAVLALAARSDIKAFITLSSSNARVFHYRSSSRARVLSAATPM